MSRSRITQIESLLRNPYAVPCIAIFAGWLKLVYVSLQTQTLFATPLWWTGLAAVSLLGWGALLLLGRSGRAQALVALVLSSSVTFVLFTDAAYYRYFIDLPTLSQLAQVGQLSKVGGSVQSVLRFSDLLLLVDLPLYLWLAVQNRPFMAPRYFQALIALALSGLAFGIVDFVKNPMQRGVGQARFKNYAVAREFGLPLYHLLDLRDQATRAWRLSGSPNRPLAALPSARRSFESVVQPGQYRGAAKGMNVVVILLESLQSIALEYEIDGQPVMPFLSEYTKSTLYFPRMYDQTNHASSADGEFVLATSLHPAAQGTTAFLYQNNSFQALPSHLNEGGYHTVYIGYYDGSFWNARRMMDAFGFRQAVFAPFGPPPRPDEQIGWGLADYPTLIRAYGVWDTLNQPFYSVVKCSMGHHPFNELRPEQRELKLPLELQETIVGEYLQLCRFRDNQLRAFLTQFHEMGLAESTVLILTGDHASPMTPAQLEPILSEAKLPLKAAWALEQSVPLLIRIPGVEGHRFQTPVGQVDFAPTVLHLLGLTPDRPVFFGESMFARKGGIFFRKAAYARLGDVLLSILDRKAYSVRSGVELPFAEHAGLADEALKQWKASDDILDYDLISDLREALHAPGPGPGRP